MRIRPFRSSRCLSLLAALWASAAAPANAQDGAATPTEEAGSVRATLSISRVSLDLQALGTTACGDPAGIPIDRPVSRCKGSAINLSAPAKTGQPQTSSGQVETSCGVWDYTLVPDPAVVRPGSQIAIREVPGDPARGVFAGVFDLNVTAHLTHRATSQTAEFMLSFEASVAGPWVLADRRELPTTENLILLADLVEDQAVPYESCFTPDDTPETCAMEVCLVPDELKLPR